ncbi:unnamed protein product, partial [marine sediment metagenome]
MENIYKNKKEDTFGDKKPEKRFNKISSTDLFLCP